jgi:hypothetical protein
MCERLQKESKANKKKYEKIFPCRFENVNKNMALSTASQIA